jgi:hypothetical protein
MEAARPELGCRTKGKIYERCDIIGKSLILKRVSWMDHGLISKGCEGMTLSVEGNDTRCYLCQEGAKSSPFGF